MSSSTERSDINNHDYKQNVPELRFSGFEDDWDNNSLNNLLDNKGYIRGPFGSDLRKADLKKKGIPVYEQQHAIYGHRTFRYFVDSEKYAKLSRFTVKNNDLIVSCSGTIGKISLIEENDEKGIINQALLILRVNPNIVESKFLKYFLETKKGHNSLISTAGGSSQINIAKKDLIINTKVKTPSLFEQQKIIKFLEIVDRKIELMEKKYNNFLSIKKFFIKYLFDKLNIEKNKIVTLGNISEINIGFTPSTKNTQFWEGNNKWLSITDLNKKYVDDTSKKISDEAIKNKKIIKKNTLVMSFKLTLGKLAILSEDMFSNEAICNFKWNMEVDTEYMYYYLNSIRIEKYGAIAAKGVTLNKEILKTIPVLLPSYKTQQEIGFFLKIIDDKISLINKEIELNKEFKRSLLSKMFC